MADMEKKVYTSEEVSVFAVIANILTNVKFVEGGILIPQEAFVKTMHEIAGFTELEAQRQKRDDAIRKLKDFGEIES